MKLLKYNGDAMTLAASAATLAQAVTNKLTSSSGTKNTLKPATWRGVPFAVTDTDTGGGRRLAIHEYPGREIGWAEDMGKKQRTFRITGFVLDGDVLLGSQTIAMQRSKLQTACETKGTGTLVHPTMGTLTVALDRWSISEGLDAVNTSRVQLFFVESGQQSYPTISAVTSGTSSASSALKNALIKVAVSTVATLISGGSISTSSLLATATGLLSVAGVRADIVAQVAGWASKVIVFANDATALYKIASVLPAADGESYGRYTAGANSGLTGSNTGTYAADTTINDLISDASAQRVAVSVAATAANDSAANVSLADITDLADAITDMIDALTACCADPADAIRILLQMISTTLSGSSTSATTAIDLAVWQAAAAALTTAVASYQPSSSDDAQARIEQIGPVLDSLSLLAADAGADDVYTALRQCRASIVAALKTAAATVAQLKTFTYSQSLPALLLAQQIYGDASRVDQLISQIAPANPLFCPTTFEALAT